MMTPRDKALLQCLNWDIRRTGRTWSVDEYPIRYKLCPAKIDILDGKLFWDETDRLILLGLLLENVGADVVVRMGDPDVWRNAVAALPEKPDKSFSEAKAESADRDGSK